MSPEQVAKLVEGSRELAARAVALLKSYPRPSSFAGRKTQEPFPAQDDPISRTDIQKLIHSELQPPQR
jgi:hypothetical protein